MTSLNVPLLGSQNNSSSNASSGLAPTPAQGSNGGHEYSYQNNQPQFANISNTNALFEQFMKMQMAQMQMQQQQMAQMQTQHQMSQVIQLSNGGTYRGQLSGNLPHGYGVLTYPPGNPLHRQVYEGNFVDGLPHGQGTCTTNSGQILTGTFDKDQMVQGNLKNLNGNYCFGTFRNGRLWTGTACHFANGKWHKNEYTNGSTGCCVIL